MGILGFKGDLGVLVLVMMKHMAPVDVKGKDANERGARKRPTMAIARCSVPRNCSR